MKLRGYFYILACCLLLVFGFVFVESIDALSWKTFAMEAVIVLLLIYLAFFYRKAVRPLQNISNGMDLLRELD